MATTGVAGGALDALFDGYMNYLAVERGLSRHTLDSYGRVLRRYLAQTQEDLRRAHERGGPVDRLL